MSQLCRASEATHAAFTQTQTLGQVSTSTRSFRAQEPTSWGTLFSLDGNANVVIDKTCNIGRAAGCEVIVADERVSNVHCTISRVDKPIAAAADAAAIVGGGSPGPLRLPSSSGDTAVPSHYSELHLTDHSSNGTYIGDRRVGKGRQVVLRSGDIISIVPLKRTRTSRAVATYVARYMINVNFPQHGVRRDSPPPPAAADVTPLDESAAITDWQAGGLIGRGGNGTVYVGINGKTGELFAVKEVRKQPASAQQLPAPRAAGGYSPPPASRSAPPARRKFPEAAASPYRRVDEDDDVDDDDDEPSAGGMARARTMDTIEHAFLRRLSHKRIVRYLGFEEDDANLRIFLEYVSGGSLCTLLKQFVRFGEAVTRLYTTQILQGLDYLHGKRVVHGDIKPANILVSHRGEIKLSDFGTSRLLPPQSGGGSGCLLSDGSQSQEQRLLLAGAGSSGMAVGTPLYMSPEQCRTGVADFPSDVWALGLVVYEMLSGANLHEAAAFQSPVQALFAIGRITERPSLTGMHHVASHAAIDFVGCCLDPDAEQRWSITELLRHPFIVMAAANNSASVVANDEAAQSMPCGSSLPAHNRYLLGLAQQQEQASSPQRRVSSGVTIAFGELAC